MSSIFKPRTLTVRIYGGDYHSRLEAKQREVIEAAESVDNNGVARLGSKPEHVRLGEEYDALVAEAAEYRVDVTLTQIGRRQIKELRKAHPPRKAGIDGATEIQERGDALIGVNEEAFKEALVRASVIDPELTEDDYDALSEGAFIVLAGKALDLNYGFVSDPKETLLVSHLTPESGETSS